MHHSIHSKKKNIQDCGAIETDQNAPSLLSLYGKHNNTNNNNTKDNNRSKTNTKRVAEQKRVAAQSFIFT